MRKAEWQLDANAYLEEQWQWAPGRLHHVHLCQQMFLHATATGQSKHDHAISKGQREPSPKQDLVGEPTAMELVHPISTQDVYQLQRLPGRGHCEEATEEHCHREILNSLKEHLQLKWQSTQLKGEQRQSLANVPLPDPHTEFAAANR